ncbi:MAG: ThuA domain-containing protein [Verrucomicrobia bacterium]|nr:ThuA domain-containing protein [Verrucomicrobiota bacterium]
MQSPSTFLALAAMLLSSLLILAPSSQLHAAPLRVLLIDGQNNHDWKSSSPWIKRILEETKLFIVDVATTPPKGGDMSSFNPDLSPYQVLVSNYNGEPWSKQFELAFEAFVREGGGFVPVHAADNAFPAWPQYNEMIGVGGWNDRNEKSGPWVYWDKKIVRDTSPGRGGSHGKQHEFKVVHREPDHPIVKGLPSGWMHAKDELYDRLRGPAVRMTVLATAFADVSTGGTGRHEPMLMALTFGKGRIFHTALGHNNGPDLTAQYCIGFITTLQRGVEWAATGQVTQKPPTDFPMPEKSSLRKP